MGSWRAGVEKWVQRARRPAQTITAHDDGFTGSQIGPLTLLGLIIGAIVGWLLASGALPTPDWLPVTPGEPLRAALIFGAVAALGVGGIGLLIDLSARIARRDEETTQPSSD